MEKYEELITVIVNDFLPSKEMDAARQRERDKLANKLTELVNDCSNEAYILGQDFGYRMGYQDGKFNSKKHN